MLRIADWDVSICKAHTNTLQTNRAYFSTQAGQGSSLSYGIFTFKSTLNPRVGPSVRCSL